MNGNEEPKTRAQKLAEPILNPKQVLVFCIVVIYEVISNLLPLIFGVDLNLTFVLINIGVGILAFAVTMMLRAAYPKLVPDSSLIGIFKTFFKQIVDALLDNPKEESDLKTLLERMIVWSVREWDVIYQEELADSINYYKKKFKVIDEEEIIEDVEEAVEEIELEPEVKAKILIAQLQDVLELVDPETKASIIGKKKVEPKEKVAELPK